LKTSKRLGIALWGLGSHARKNILPAIAKSDVFDLIGVFTRNSDNAQQVSDEYGGRNWSSQEAMLVDQDVGVVYIATPTGLHFEHCQAVIESNKHIICEKALTDDGNKSLQLIEQAREKGLVLCEAFMFLYHPHFRKVLEIIQNASFGKIYNISCYFGLPELENPGFRQSKELGGGAFLDVGSYTFSAVVSLFEILPDSLTIEIDDQHSTVDMSGVAHLNFGSMQHAYLNWGYQRAYRAELMVWGENQSLYADRIFSKKDCFEAEIVLRNVYGQVEKITVDPANSFIEMFNLVQSAIQNKDDKELLYQQAQQQAKMMCLAEEATKSSDYGK